MAAPSVASWQKCSEYEPHTFSALVTTSNDTDLVAPTKRLYIGGTGHLCVGMRSKSEYPTTQTFTAVADNTCTAVNHGMIAGQIVVVTTTDTDLPAGLSINTHYFVIAGGLTANTFQLSATLGGASVDITDAGTGTHAIHKIDALISALPVGAQLPIAVNRIFATGTTATLIIAFW